MLRAEVIHMQEASKEREGDGAANGVDAKQTNVNAQQQT
jgi:hypothetical protein